MWGDTDEFGRVSLPSEGCTFQGVVGTRKEKEVCEAHTSGTLGLYGRLCVVSAGGSIVLVEDS